MTDRIFRENITHLTGQLAFEPSGSKRRQLARRIKQEIENLAAVDHDPVAMPQVQNGDYWKSRAERTRQQAQRYRSAARRILPVAVVGSAAAKSTIRGYLYGAVNPFT